MMPTDSAPISPTRESIYFVVGASSLGPLLLASSEKGLCFSQFGDDQEVLEQCLVAAFTPADCQPASGKVREQLQQWLALVQQRIAGVQVELDMPLDLRGTPFQHQVWRALCAINAGQPISYSALAAQIGKPRAVRAVASACAANRIAVLIPCHRVLRSDGGLGGYRWGLERKGALLEAEARTR